MLETLDLSQRLAKGPYKAQMPGLQIQLRRVQRACKQANLATVIVFEGWAASGKGSMIRKLTQRLDPRGFSLHVIRKPRTFESHLPWMWRFWVKIPSWGHMAIFDHCWYGRVLRERVEGLVEERQWREAYGDIVSFERALVDDRYQVVKFFLHISKKEQKERLNRLKGDPTTSWRVRERDWRQLEDYDGYVQAYEEMLERTESEWAPWTLVEATDRRWARVRVFETVLRRMSQALERHGFEVPEPLDADVAAAASQEEG